MVWLHRLLCSVMLLGLFPLAAHAVCFEGDVSVAPGNVPLAREYDGAELVMIGRVTSEVAVPEGREGGLLEGVDYRVVPTTIFKGGPVPQVVLFSENSSGRFPMIVGQQYLLFVFRMGALHVVDNCGSSGLLSETGALIDQVRRLSQ